MKVLWMERREIRFRYSSLSDIPVCIPGHAINPGMLMYSSVNAINGIPGTGLCLLGFGRPDLSAKQGRFESQSKANPVDGIIGLGIAKPSLLDCKGLHTMRGTPLKPNGGG